MTIALASVLSWFSLTGMPSTKSLADEYTVVFRSPDPGAVFCYTPGLCRLPTGRLIASLDLGGPGVPKLPGPKAAHCTEGGSWQGKAFSSDDGGKTWVHRVDFPGAHARPFTAGRSLYILGHTTDLFVLRSDDGGETWTEPRFLSEGQKWHQSACNVHYKGAFVYLVMERRVSEEIKGWYVGELAPVLMRANINDDLTQRSSWTFASELSFQKAFPSVNGESPPTWSGIPFYDTRFPEVTEPAPKRRCAPMGWLECNVVEFVDPDHIWHDKDGKTFHLWMRSHTGGTGYAALAKVVERPDGTMETMLEKSPSGRDWLWVPCPGGHLRFHVLYDEPTKLYWLLSSQPTDSMTRADRLGPERFNLPNNERHRLQLHFSKNMVDWCFVGMVAMGESPRQARHYASMTIDGEDLAIVSRSGDKNAKSAHDGNIITFHRVKEFRKLVY